MGNFKTAASASASWSLVRKKLLAAQDPQASKDKPKTTTNADGTSGGDDNEGSAKSTPAKKKNRVTKREKESSPNGEAASQDDHFKFKEEGHEVIKSEFDQDEVNSMTATPSKKRGRKPKDDTKPSPKRVKAKATDKAATNINQEDSEKVPDSSAVPIKEEANEDDVVLPTELEEGVLQAASDGLIQVHTP